MVARMWSWPPPARKFRVRLVVRRADGLAPPPASSSSPGASPEAAATKVAVEVRWKGPRASPLGSLRRVMHSNRMRLVAPAAAVAWKEFERVETFTATSHRKATASFYPWDLAFSVSNDSNKGPKGELVMGTVSVNLAEYTSSAEEVEIILPLSVPNGASESSPSLHRIPSAVVEAYNLASRHSLNIFTDDAMKTRIQTQKIKSSLYLSFGWAHFVRKKALKEDDIIMLKMKTLAIARMIFFGKNGRRKQPTVHNPATTATTGGFPEEHGTISRPNQGISAKQTSSMPTLSDKLCFRNFVYLTKDMKCYLKTNTSEMHPLEKLYLFTMNKTAVNQNEMYFSSEYTSTYIKPHLLGKKTTITASTLGTTPSSMTITMSTDDRCNITAGWTKFVTQSVLSTSAPRMAMYMQPFISFECTLDEEKTPLLPLCQLTCCYNLATQLYVITTMNHESPDITNQLYPCMTA
uniref:C2 NT-type domain-containing protein n=1 Tax=Oryza brachyantha TaxID=4533 RepID=J3L0S4_ORYBR